MVYSSTRLEEIHPSFGQLEKLVYVAIEGCYYLKMVPPITRSKKLETLALSACNVVYNLSGLWFFSGCLRKLDLRTCNLADGDITPACLWELPNLQELNLQGNRFIRLNFSLLQLPRLKYLNISSCYHLVELSDLPSSIAVVKADWCRSLESFGNISNCKWLWKVSLLGKNKLGGDILLNSILKGNVKDYFISIRLICRDIWRAPWPPLVWFNLVKTYNMRLPHDWYNRFSGILLFVRYEGLYLHTNISIKQGLDEDLQSLLWQESSETLTTSYHETYVGYVSLSSLRHIGCLNSTYNMISFSLNDEYMYEDEYMSGAVLVPRYPKDDAMQKTKVVTDSSQFWEEDVGEKTFTVQRDSNSSIEILWTPLHQYW